MIRKNNFICYTKKRKLDARMISKGFSVIELLTVMAIGIVLMTLILPDFGDSMKNTKLRTSVHHIFDMLWLAQSTARAQKQIALVDFRKKTGNILVCSLPEGSQDITCPDTVKNRVSIARSFNVIPSKPVAINQYGLYMTNHPNDTKTGAINLVLCDDRDKQEAWTIKIETSGRLSIVHNSTFDPVLECNITGVQ